MAIRQSDAVTIEAIINALSELKQDLSISEYKVYSMNRILVKYKINFRFGNVVKEMEIIKQDEDSISLRKGIRWDYGNGVIDTQLGRDILELIRDKQRSDKRVYRDSTDEVVKTQPLKRVKPKPVELTKELPGTPMGLRQLDFIKETYRNKPTKVVIDDVYEFENIQMLQYEVDKSQVTISMFMYADEIRRVDSTSLIGKVKVNNRILAFKEGAESDKTSVLFIYTVDIGDPYKDKS